MSEIPPPPGPEPSSIPPSTEPLQYQSQAGEVDSSARMYGMLCHLLSLCALLSIPFGHILGPLVVWLIKKDSHPFVNDQGKESLNFQITMTIAGLVAGVLMLVVIGFILLPIVLIVWLVLVIIASVKANGGVYYRYPINIRFIK